VLGFDTPLFLSAEIIHMDMVGLLNSYCKVHSVYQTWQL